MVDRQQLDELIMKNDTNDWWQPALFLKNTKHLLPPELEILADPPPEDQNYNCFLYAFGLHMNKDILRETNGFIYDSYAKHLLEIGVLEKTTNPTDGDYVVYQDLANYPDALTHIGILDGEKVVSKWAWGPLIKHKLWDVPAEYGNDVFYIKSVPLDRATQLYEQHRSFNVKLISASSKYANRKYTVQAYDPNWSEQFEAEANNLKGVLKDQLLTTEHIGSTSVPGMAGKPTIDILATLQNIEDADGFETTLQPLGYTFLGQYIMENSRLYVKEENGTRLVNLHFFQHDHPHVNSMLKLRDYLRTHPEAVQEYSNLKFELAEKYPKDYAAYRKYKDEWMNAFKKSMGLND